MDCLQAREIISEAFDRGVAEVPLAAEAREHCRGCAECRRFVEGLALLRKTPAPAAPPELIDAIVDRSRMMAEAGLPRPVVPQPAGSGSTADPGVPSAPVVLLQSVPRPDTQRASWLPRVAVAAVAVAIAGFALFLSFQGFRALKPQPAGLQPLPTQAGGAQPATGAQPQSDSRMMSGVGSAAPVAAAGARYVALGDEAYTWVGVRTPDPASITQLDTQVTTSLDSSAAPTQRTVWRSKTDADILFVRSNDASETYAAFRRVVRTFGGKLYSLYGGGVTAYEQWPALPSRFSTPTAEDGSPTFVQAGKDDTGLEIYAPTGLSPGQGFAVAPGTTPGDPAAGDPNWTWWFPKP